MVTGEPPEDTSVGRTANCGEWFTVFGDSTLSMFFEGSESEEDDDEDEGMHEDSEFPECGLETIEIWRSFRNAADVQGARTYCSSGVVSVAELCFRRRWGSIRRCVVGTSEVYSCVIASGRAGLVVSVMM